MLTNLSRAVLICFQFYFASRELTSCRCRWLKCNQPICNQKRVYIHFNGTLAACSQSKLIDTNAENVRCAIDEVQTHKYLHQDANCTDDGKFMDFLIARNLNIFARLRFAVPILCVCVCVFTYPFSGWIESQPLWPPQLTIVIISILMRSAFHPKHFEWMNTPFILGVAFYLCRRKWKNWRMNWDPRTPHTSHTHAMCMAQATTVLKIINKLHSV